jgi:ABC-type sulfate/molybdate transport systems ATPase subunit
LRDIRERFGVTILIVSHDRNIALHVDRVVGIQDGKVATETTAAMQGEANLMLDSAGRLQIPKALREKYGIGAKVTLEQTDDGLVIKKL